MIKYKSEIFSWDKDMKKYILLLLSVMICVFALSTCTENIENEDPTHGFIPEYTQTELESVVLDSDTDTTLDDSMNNEEEINSESSSVSQEENSDDVNEDTLLPSQSSSETGDATSQEESNQNNSETTEKIHVDTLDENGYCDICGEKIEEIESQSSNEDVDNEEESNTEETNSALFNKFYDSNFDLTLTTHSNGSKMTEKSDTYTAGIYELKFYNYTNVYKNARDAKGNPALKVGNTTYLGSFEFNVPSEIQIVILEIAKYKDHASSVLINGREYTLTKNSNDGEYDRIIIDCTSNKVVTFTTTNEGKTCMIRSIAFIK